MSEMWPCSGVDRLQRRLDPRPRKAKAKELERFGMLRLGGFVLLFRNVVMMISLYKLAYLISTEAVKARD
jgi:hypothetical protein